MLVVALVAAECEDRGFKPARTLDEIRQVWRVTAQQEQNLIPVGALLTKSHTHIVPAQVIAEVWNLKAGKRPSVRLVDMLSTGRVIEKNIPMFELLARIGYRRLLEECGPTDAVLMRLAEQTKSSLITDDQALAAWAEQRLVRVYKLAQIDQVLQDDRQQN